MKSKLFRDYDLNSADTKDSITAIKRDFAHFSKIEQAKLSEFIEQYIDMFIERDSVKSDIAEKELIEKYNLSDSDYERISKVLKFFLESFLEEKVEDNDDPNNIVLDMLKLKMIEDHEKSRLHDILENLKTLATEKVHHALKEFKSIVRTSTQLDRLRTNVSIRAIFENEYTSGDNVNMYQPKCIGFIPIAEISMLFSNNNIEQISFVSDSITIKRIIEKLTIVLKEMDAAQEFANLD